MIAVIISLKSNLIVLSQMVLACLRLIYTCFAVFSLKNLIHRVAIIRSNYSALPFIVTILPVLSTSEQLLNEASDNSVIPRGFFDDPLADLKARGVDIKKIKKKEEKREEEELRR